MSIFENVIKIDNNDNIIFNNWIEWEHFDIPNKPDFLRQILRFLIALSGHCLMCTALDGCFFVERIMPKQPIHEKCDCKKKPVSFYKINNLAQANMPIEKLSKYIFSNDQNSKGKKSLFEKMGYTKDDIYNLQSQFKSQALNQYLSGNYILKNLDNYGQRVAIKITLNNHSFYSGWMLEPEGTIRNTTPFGGWVNEKIWYRKIKRQLWKF